MRHLADIEAELRDPVVLRGTPRQDPQIEIYFSIVQRKVLPRMTSPISNLEAQRFKFQDRYSGRSAHDELVGKR